MRQAGRSLPEYRAIRERHAFFEINQLGRADRRGDAAAGAPPRRRRGRHVRRHHDPGRRDGRRGRARRGRRARRREAGSHRRGRRAARVPDPDEAVAPILEAIRHRPPRARSRAGRGRLLRRPVHRRRLPRRGPAVARLRRQQGADVPRAGRLAGAAREARRDLRRATRPRRPTPGADAVQLFDSWVGVLSARPTTPSSSRPGRERVLAALAEAGCPTIHFGTGAVDAPAGDGRGGRRRDRARLADPARRRLGAVGADRAVQGTSTPRCCSGRGIESRQPRATSSPVPSGRPGHIFNLGHGVLPGHRPRRPRPAPRARPHAETSAAGAPRRARGARSDAVRSAAGSCRVGSLLPPGIRPARPAPSASVSL